MPRIFLKPNSPEFADPKTAKPKTRRCDMQGCPHEGAHKAPKHRGLNDYYHFCLDHVREYNQAWNFFDGLSDAEAQEHMINSLYGDRPTWVYGVNGNAEDVLYDRIWRARYGEDSAPRGKEDRKKQTAQTSTPELEALAIMGLEPPVTLTCIKTRYKELAKKHHPDLNKGCSKSEELLKRINMAYTILKLAYGAYEKLPARS